MFDLVGIISTVAVALGVGSALYVAFDVAAGHHQKMWIMNVVWPATALWSGPVGVWVYRRYGGADGGNGASIKGSMQATQPFPVQVVKGTTHCGSGCALGDMVAAVVFLVAPFTTFGREMFGSWVYELVAAFSLGIAFQYFTIKPMRHESAGEGLKDALKADTLSLAAWQIGMYGWMAIATFAIFHHELRATSIVFWFMMQLGMFAGFATAYPVNWWLLRKGVKEAM